MQINLDSLMKRNITLLPFLETTQLQLQFIGFAITKQLQFYPEISEIYFRGPGRQSLGMMKVFCMLISVVVIRLHTLIETPLNIHLKLLDFIVRSLYFNKVAKKKKKRNYDLKIPV